MSQPTGGNREGSEKRVAYVRLLIVDDQPRVRRSLEALLIALRWSNASSTQIPIVIVGKAKDGQQAVAQVQALHPDVVVLDLPFHDSANPALPAETELEGLAAIRTIKSRWPDVRIVVLTMYATDRAAILLAGADVFLLKGCPTSELLDAVLKGFSHRADTDLSHE